MSASATITVALDWTPNTNHEGFFVALADGLYKDAGLEVVLRPPADAACNGLTPGRQVAAGIATFAVSPSETAVYVKNSCTLLLSLNACEVPPTFLRIVRISGKHEPAHAIRSRPFVCVWDDMVVVDSVFE